MNKIIEAINVISKMKEIKNFTANVEAKITDNDFEFASLKLLTKKDIENCGCSGDLSLIFEGDNIFIAKDKNAITLKSVIDGEEFNLKAESSKNVLDGKCLHRHNTCCSKLGKVEKLLFLLKVINKTELKSLENNNKVFTLALTGEELPKYLKQHICEHFQAHHDSVEDCCKVHSACCSQYKEKILNKVMKRFSGLQCKCEISNVEIKLTVNDKNLVEQLIISANTICKDKDGSDRKFILNIDSKIHSHNSTEI